MQTAIVLALLGQALVAQIAPEAPTYCGSYQSTQDNGRWVESYLGSDGLSDKTLGYIARAWCDKPKDAARQQEVARWRQLIAQETGFSAELTRDTIAARLDGEKFENEQRAACNAVMADTEESLRARADGLAMFMLMQCRPGYEEMIEWFADETAEVSPIYRAALVYECLKPQGLSSFSADLGASGLKGYYSLTTYARCGLDARRLDEKAFIDAINADERLTPSARVLARETFAMTKAWADKMTAYYEGLAKKDPDFKAVLFDEPEAAFEAWNKDYAANKEAWDTVIDLERKAYSPSRSAVKGCGPKLRPLLAKLVAGKTIEENATNRIFFDSYGYRLARALAFCEAAEGNASAAWTLYYSLAGTGVQQRGPRYAGTVAALAKIDAILADRPKFTDKSGSPNLPDFEAESVMTNIDLNSGNSLPGAGPIQSLKPQDDKVLITFATVTWQEPVYDCKETNKVDYIDWSTGKVVYKQNCVKKGMEKRTSKESPVLVPKEYAAALKAGQFLSFSAAYGNPRTGLPQAGFADAKKTKMVTFLGQKL